MALAGEAMMAAAPANRPPRTCAPDPTPTGEHTRSSSAPASLRARLEQHAWAMAPLLGSVIAARPNCSPRGGTPQRPSPPRRRCIAGRRPRSRQLGAHGAASGESCASPPPCTHRAGRAATADLQDHAMSSDACVSAHWPSSCSTKPLSLLQLWPHLVDTRETTAMAADWGAGETRCSVMGWQCVGPTRLPPHQGILTRFWGLGGCSLARCATACPGVGCGRVAQPCCVRGALSQQCGPGGMSECAGHAAQAYHSPPSPGFPHPLPPHPTFLHPDCT